MNSYQISDDMNSYQCDSWASVHYSPHWGSWWGIVIKSSGIAPMFDEMWQEIADAPGEIFDMDIPELRDEKFDVNEYLNGNIDYWNNAIPSYWHRVWF